MTPEEMEELKKDMGRIFLEEFKKVDFRKLIEEVCKEVIDKEGFSWG